MKRILFLLLFLSTISGFAQPLRVAVAANAQHVLKILQADFQKKTGIELQIIAGSSGKLMAQIQNGAPYDVFLSADMEYPNTLYRNGLGVSKPKVYALGSLIVCSPNLKLDNWKNVLLSAKVSKVAIATPAVAPYGKAAKETLLKYGLWEKLQPKLVFGESVSQTNTYLATGSVDVAITTEALIYENSVAKFNWLRVDKSAYNKIEQGMLILKHAKKGNYQKAIKFANYLSSIEAKRVFKSNGYLLP